MNLKKTAFPIIFFIIFIFIFSMPGFVKSAAAQSQSSPAGTYFYGGIITNITDSSITLYSGVTVYITADTKCGEPSPSRGGKQTITVISCSQLKTGESVRVSAVKNSSGQLIAVTIQEYFA